MTDATGAFHRPYWGEPRYLSDGDTVWLPRSHDHASGKTSVIRCVVACAAGDHARIVCREKGIDRWVRLDSLLVPPTDPRHWNQAGTAVEQSPMTALAELAAMNKVAE